MESVAHLRRRLELRLLGAETYQDIVTVELDRPIADRFALEHTLDIVQFALIDEVHPVGNLQGGILTV